MRSAAGFAPVSPSEFKGSICSLEEFNRALDYYPAAFSGNPLHLLFVADAGSITTTSNPPTAVREYRHNLDSQILTDERREFLITPPGASVAWPFPAYTPTARPLASSVSEVLFDNFEEATRLLPLQREIGKTLESEARQIEPDVVALMVVDGLSYYDLPDEPCVTPCLVNGVTITQFGYREVVGKPHISQRLFAAGFKEQHGFTFFDRDSNTLASDLYAMFGKSEVDTVQTFDEVLQALGTMPLSRAFIQITATGLDHLCHQHHDRPPREEYLARVLKNFDNLVECLSAPRQPGGNSRTVLAYLTSDHGILWRDELPQNAGEVVTDLTPEDSHHPRYIPGARRRHYARTLSVNGDTNTLLRFPYLTRRLRRTEWGVHGGISAWESIVPLLRRSA